MKEILKNAKTIAIVGLSPDSAKDSNIVATYLQNKGYCIIPIYPKGDFILNCKVYKSLKTALDENKIDVVVAFRKSEAINQIADEILKSNNKPKLLWLQEGIKNESAKLAMQRANIAFIEDSCIMIYCQNHAI